MIEREGVGVKTAAMASKQPTRDVITLKGSAAIVSEFLCYSGIRRDWPGLGWGFRNLVCVGRGQGMFFRV